MSRPTGTPWIGGQGLSSVLLGVLMMAACSDSPTVPTPTCPTEGSVFATRVVGWWLPECSEDQNRFVDPGTVLGPPDTPRDWASGHAGS